MNNISNTSSIVFETQDVESPHVTISYTKLRKKRYEICKRIFDFIMSIIALLCLAPVFLITAILIKLDSSGPVFYTQDRVGKNGKQFKMYKFRSMCADASERLKYIQCLNEKDGPIFKIINDPRITRVGKHIRRSSIDELPQLINIIRGDMAIVGPRPPLICEAEQYTPFQAQRLSVKPGLTCYWQISGRSNLSFQEWVQLDIKYINERGLLTDLKIILRTIPAVMLRVGAY